MIYTVTANQRIYTIVDDLTTTFQVLVAGQVMAAASGAAVRRFRLQVDHPDVFVKTAPDGFFCLAGVPERIFPELDTTNYLLSLQIDAPTYQSQTLQLNVPMNTLFPLPQLAIALTYVPVRLQGRVILDTDGSPVAGATVQLTEPAHILTLRTPLHFDHAAGTTVNVCSFSPAAARQLTAPAARLSNRLALDNATGVAAGDILQIGEPAQAEYMVFDAAGAGPGELILRGGLRRSYPIGTTVRLAALTLDSRTETTAQEAAAGEGLLLLNNDFPPGPTPLAIEIADAAPARFEYHLLNGLSDGEGYYRLDGISRLDTLTLHAVAGPDAQERPWTIDPRQPVNIVDFRLTPP